MANSLHSFRGNTLEEAYRHMRGRLGEHALVVRTTEVRREGFWGLLGGREIEVTASMPQSIAPRPAPARASNPYGPATKAKIAQFEQLVRNTQERTGIEARQYGRASAGSPEIPPGLPPQYGRSPDRAIPATEGLPASAYSREIPPGPPFSKGGNGTRHYSDLEPDARRPLTPALSQGEREKEWGQTHEMVRGSLAPKLAELSRPREETEILRKEVAQMRDMLAVLLAEKPGAGLPPEFAPHYRRLVESGVSRTIAASLIAEVGDGLEEALLRNERVVAERLKLLLGRRLSATGGVRVGASRTVVALVGPTGVGKTTNAAKIAAQFAVRQGKRVALITTDTYRIAAPEQLRVYANIIGLPMRVVNDAREMRDALTEFAEFDLVLMDTAGNSQFNTKQINELRLMMAAARPNEVILVASANTPLDDLRSTVANFAVLHPTSLLFSKLDETQRFGHLYTVAVESGLPLSYFSDGQDVPDDLLVVETGALAALVLEGTVHRG